jgi:hypothetical protein
MYPWAMITPSMYLSISSSVRTIPTVVIISHHRSFGTWRFCFRHQTWRLIM